jgi:hypothetical protein
MGPILRGCLILLDLGILRASDAGVSWNLALPQGQQ